MKTFAILSTTTALLIGLALAQPFGPPADRGPAAFERVPGGRAPVVAETQRETRQARAVAVQEAREQAIATQQARVGGAGSLAGQLKGVVASALGLTEAEVHERKAAGESFESIAEAAGVPVATLEAAYLGARAGIVAQLLADATISELQAAQMTARGPAAFAALMARAGCDEGRNLSGEPLFANRATTARGPNVGEPVTEARQVRRGPQARW